MNEQTSQDRFENWYWPHTDNHGHDSFSKERAEAAWMEQERFWSKRVEEMEARIASANIVIEAARKWMKENNPTCEESFYQCDSVNQELPELGITIFNALKVHDENACPNCQGKGTYITSTKESPHDHWEICYCQNAMKSSL